MNFNENTNFDTAGVAVFSLLDGTRGGLLGYKRVTTYTEAQAKYLPALIKEVDILDGLLWLNSGSSCALRVATYPMADYESANSAHTAMFEIFINNEEWVDGDEGMLTVDRIRKCTSIVRQAIKTLNDNGIHEAEDESDVNLSDEQHQLVIDTFRSVVADTQLWWEDIYD